MSNPFVVVVCQNIKITKRVIDAVSFSGFTSSSLLAVEKLGPHVLLTPTSGEDASILLVSDALPSSSFSPQSRCVITVKNLSASKVAATVQGYDIHRDFVSGLGQICVVTTRDANDEIPEIVLVEVADPSRKTELLLQWAVEQQRTTSTITQQKVSQKKQVVVTKDTTTAVAASATASLQTKGTTTTSTTQVSQSSNTISIVPKGTKEVPGQQGIVAGPPLWKPPVGINVQSLYISVLHQSKYLPMYANTAVGVPFVNDLFEGQVTTTLLLTHPTNTYSLLTHPTNMYSLSTL